MDSIVKFFADDTENVFDDHPNLELQQVVAWFTLFDKNNASRRNDTLFLKNCLAMAKSLQAARQKELWDSQRASLFFIFFKLFGYTGLEFHHGYYYYSHNAQENNFRKIVHNVLPLFGVYFVGFSTTDFAQVKENAEVFEEFSRTLKIFLEVLARTKKIQLDDRLLWTIWVDMILRSTFDEPLVDLTNFLDSVMHSLLRSKMPIVLFEYWNKLFIGKDRKEKALNLVIRSLCSKECRGLYTATDIKQLILKSNFLDEGKQFDEATFKILFHQTMEWSGNKYNELKCWLDIIFGLDDTLQHSLMKLAVGRAQSIVESWDLFAPPYLRQIIVQAFKNLNNIEEAIRLSPKVIEYNKPLKLPDKNLLSCLDKSTLLSCTSVCKAWNWLANSVHLNQVVLNLLQSKEVTSLKEETISGLIRLLIDNGALSNDAAKLKFFYSFLFTGKLTFPLLLKLSLIYPQLSLQSQPGLYDKCVRVRKTYKQAHMELRHLNEFCKLEHKFTTQIRPLPSLYIKLCEDYKKILIMQGVGTLKPLLFRDQSCLCLPLIVSVSVKMELMSAEVTTSLPECLGSTTAADWESIRAFNKLKLPNTLPTYIDLDSWKEVIKPPFDAIYYSFNNGSYRESSIKLCEKYLDKLNFIWDEPMEQFKLRTCSDRLSEVLKRVTEGLQGYYWLKAHLKPTLADIAIPNDMSLKEAEAQIRAFTDVTRFIFYLGRIVESTPIYAKILLYYLQPNAEVDTLIATVNGAINSLISQRMQLTEAKFVPLAKLIIANNLPERSLYTELAELRMELHKIFEEKPTDASLGDTIVEEAILIENVESGVRISEFTSKMIGIQAKFRDWNIEVTGINGQQLEEFINVSVGHATKQLHRLEESLKMRLFHLDYFMVAFSCGPLIDFFQSFPTAEDFSAKTSALHSDTQLDEYESNLLDVAEKAYDLLTPLIKLKQQGKIEKQTVDSKDLGGRVAEKLAGDEHSMKNKLQVIQEANRNLDDIKSKYSQIDVGLEGILPQITMILKQGQFQSSSTSRTWKVVCHDDKITRDAFALEDLAAGCIFLNTAVSTEALETSIAHLRRSLKNGNLNTKSAASEVSLYLKKQAELGRRVAEQIMEPRTRTDLLKSSGILDSLCLPIVQASEAVSSNAFNKEELDRLLKNATEANEQLVQVQQSILSTFRSFVTQLRKVHTLHLNLVQVGHPQHNKPLFSCQYTQDGIIEQLEKLQLNLETSLQKWNDTLDKFTEPRLKLLKRVQLGRILAAIQGLLQPSSNNNEFNISDAQDILSTVAFCCFPEKSMSEHLTTQKIEEFLTSLQKETKELQATALLTAWIKTLVGKLVEADLIELTASLSLVRAKESSSDYIWKLLHEKLNRKIHPSLIMFCDDSLTKEDLLRFLSCCESFSHLPFALVGLETASPTLKEALQGWLLDIYSHNKQTQIGQLVFILQDPNASGADIAFIQAEQGELPANLGYPSKHSSINALYLLVGDPCTGKTTFIRQRIGHAAHKVIPVKEDFSLVTVVEAISQSPPQTALHFAVSCYADFKVFSRMLINLVLNGLVSDFSSGVIYSIPPLKMIDIYVELNGPSPDDTVLLSKDPASSAFLQEAIPLLRGLADVLPYQQQEFLFTAEEIRMIQFVTQFRDLNGGFFQTIAARYGVAFTPTWKKSFLRLFFNRMEWLAEYQQYSQVLRQQMQINPHLHIELLPVPELYDFLEKEALLLSSPDFGEKLNSDTPPLLSIRAIKKFDDITKASITFLSWAKFDESSKFNSHTLFLHKDEYDRNCDYDERITNERPVRLQHLMPKLRVLLAAVFDIPSHKMSRILEQQQYVLTPDFAMRLMVLREHMRANRSLILDGGTGVGKTEMLSFCSVLLNAAVGQIPDIMQEIKQGLMSEYSGKFQLGEVFRAADLKQTLYNLCELEVAEPVPPQPVPAPTPEPAATASAVLKPLWERLQVSLQTITRELLRRYKTIKLTPLLEKTKKNTLQIATKEDVIALIDELVDIRFENLFFKSLMHQRFSPEKWREFFNKAFNIAKRYTKLKLVIFIDECNTGTDSMGLLKEVFVDGTLDGDPTAIPENVFFVAAENPYIEETGNYINYNGLDACVSTKPFLVRKTNPSLKHFTVNFGQFTPHHEDTFLEVYFAMQLGNKDFVADENECKQLKNLIICSQNFLRAAHPDIGNSKKGPLEQLRIHASIRDVMRAITLYKAFRTDQFLPVISNNPLSNIQRHWIALIMAISMAYYSRIDPNNTICTRVAFSKLIDEQLTRMHIPHLFDNADLENDRHLNYFLVPTFKYVVKTYCRQLNIPNGVALTDELTENLFFILVCCETRIPIQIVGPPGCSKTLSMSIALENAATKLTPFSPMMETRYQCNPHSTDLEIKNVFKRARNRQRKNQNKRSVVFFDEGGLPKEEEAALKVIHKPLDHPEVSCVILTNNVLDAAKTNRTLLLLHTAVHTVSSPQNTEAERQEKRKRMHQLIVGCLFDRKETEHNAKITRALADAFLEANDYSPGTKRNLFNQRDIVYFLRCLKKTVKNPNSIDGKSLLRALQRNFNGIEHSAFVRLAKNFFDKLGIPQIPEIEKDDTILSIQAAMKEALSENEDPNVSSFRFVLVIDPTDNESAVTLLSELNLCSEVIQVGSFPEDRSSDAMNEVLSRMKQAITRGKHVLLVNAGELDACFYDVLNRYYKVITNAFTGGRQMIAQVGIGSHSCATTVHPNFKVIVHVPKSKLGSVPLPYLNRFEKYTLSYSQALNQYVETHLPKEIQTFQYLRDALLHFTGELHIQQHHGKLLYGCVPGQTEMSLLLRCAKATFQRISEPQDIALSPLVIPSAYHIVPLQDPVCTNPEELYQLCARKLSFHLLQLAPPAAVLLARNLPVSYATEYLLYQEHFNITSFLKSVRSKMENKNAIVTTNWIIYTRTSAVLATLRQDSHLVSSWITAVMGHDVLDVNSTVKIVQLNTFQTDFSCIAELKKIKNEAVVLIVADMRHCTQAQVTLVRNHCSEHLTNCLVAIIVHYPPEMSMDSNPCYDAIFTDRFDCIYIDDFGVTSDANDAGKAVPSASLIDADPKTWLAHSFLKKGKVDMNSLERGFDDLFYGSVAEALDSCATMRAMQLTRKEVGKAGRVSMMSKEATEFYCNPKVRLEMVKALLVKHPAWKKQAFRQFRRIWNKDTVYNLICDISRAIIAGTIVGSLLDVVRVTFKKMLRKSAIPLVELLYSHGNFHFLHQILPNSEEANLVRLMIKSCAVDISADKVHSSVSQERIYWQHPQFGKLSPAILFENIISRISTILQFTILNTPERDYREIRRNLGVIVHSKDKMLQQAVEFIDRHENLRKAYYSEYVRRQILQIDMPDGPWMALILRAIDQIKITGGDNSILKLPVIKHFFITQLRHFYNMCAPLQAFQPALTTADTEGFAIPTIEAAENIDQIGVFIGETTLSQLWYRLLGANSEEKIANWCRVYHELNSRIQIQQLYRKLRPEDRGSTQLAIEQTMYSFFTCGTPSIQKLPELVKTMSTAITEIEHKVGNDFTVYDIFILVVKCFTVGETDDPNTSISLLAEAIFDKFLLPMESCLMLFLHICNRSHEKHIKDHVIAPEAEDIVKWCNSLSPSWCIRKLKVHMEGWHKSIIQDKCNELLNNKLAFYPPNVIDSVEQELHNELTKLVKQPFAQVPNEPLADCIFYCHLKILEQENDIAGALAECNALALNAIQLPTSHIFKVALHTFILRTAANNWNTPNLLPTVENFVATTLQTKTELQPYWHLTFLSAMKDTILLDLIKNKPALDQLGLSMWNTANTASHLAFYPFAVAQSHVDNALWTKMKVASASWKDPNAIQSSAVALNAIIDAHNTKRDVALMKKFILLLCYDNFVLNSDTPLILAELTNLQKRLDIRDQEMPAFQMLAKKPKAYQQQMDYLECNFSYPAPKEVQESVFPRAMVNLLAVAVGTPNTHLYKLVFNPEEMLGKPIPGSGLLDRQLMDCGFKDNQDTMISADPASPPFQNNMLYRYTFTATIWMALSWSLLLRPSVATAMTDAKYHFLNYWQQDGLYFSNKSNQSVETLIRHSVLLRALNIFDRIATLNQASSQQIDNGHYFTILCDKLWEIANSDALPSWLQSTFTKATAVAYEQNITQAILEPITATYQTIKQELLDNLAVNGALKTLYAYRASRAKSFNSPFIPFSEWSRWVATQYPVAENEEPNRDNISKRDQWIEANSTKELVRFFGDNLELLAISSHLLELIHFFNSFQKIFSYRLTNEELNLNMLQCVQKLRTEKLESDEVIARFTRLWDRTKQIWIEVADKLNGFAVCNHQDEGEQMLPMMDDTTPIFVIIYKDEAEKGMIISAISLWIDYIQRCGESQCKTAEKRANWVNKEVLPHFQLLSDSEQYLLDLPNGSNFSNMLVACPSTAEELEDLLMQQFYCTTTTEICSRSRENLICAVKKLEYYLLDKYLAGRHVIEIGSEERKCLKLKEAVVLPTRPTMNSNNTEVLFIVRNFYDLVEQLRSKTQYQEELPSETKAVIVDNTQQNLLVLTEVLEQLIDVVLTRSTSELPTSKMDTVANELKITKPQLFELEAVKSLQMKYLGKLCELVLDTLLEGSHLYRQDGGDTLGAARLPLRQISTSLKTFSSKGQRAWLIALEQLLKFFKNREDSKLIAKKTDRLSVLLQVDLKELESQINANILKEQLPTTGAEAFKMGSLFVNELTGRSYFPFLRFLHKTYAELLFALQKEAESSSSQHIFKELPFSALSVDLPDSTVQTEKQNTKSQMDETDTQRAKPPIPSEDPNKKDSPNIDDEGLSDFKPSQAPDLPKDLDSNGISDTNLRRPATTTPFRGIVNLAQTCFMNAVMQSLRASKCFRDAVYNSKERSTVCVRTYEFLENMSRRKNEAVTRQQASDFFKLITYRSTKLNPSPYVQQDAFLFLCELYDILQKESQQVIDTLQQIQERTITCEECSETTEVTTHNELLICIPNLPREDVELNQLLLEAFSEHLTDFKCKNNHTKAKKTSAMKSPCKLLVIRIERGTPGSSEKSTTRVILPKTLTFQNAIDRFQFSLSSVVCHFGSQYNGHFVSHVFDEPSQQWYYCNDDKVTPLDDAMSREKNSYLLFYKLNTTVALKEDKTKGSNTEPTGSSNHNTNTAQSQTSSPPEKPDDKEAVSSNVELDIIDLKVQVGSAEYVLSVDPTTLVGSLQTQMEEFNDVIQMYEGNFQVFKMEDSTLVPLSQYDQTKTLVEAFGDFRFAIQAPKREEMVSCILIANTSAIQVDCAKNATINTLRLRLAEKLSYSVLLAKQQQQEWLYIPLSFDILPISKVFGSQDIIGVAPPPKDSNPAGENPHYSWVNATVEREITFSFENTKYLLFCYPNETVQQLVNEIAWSLGIPADSVLLSTGPNKWLTVYRILAKTAVQGNSLLVSLKKQKK